MTCAIVMWFAFSYAAFAFALGFAEAFRLMSDYLISEDFLIFTKGEIRFRAFFLALLTSSISFGYVFRPFLEAILLSDSRLRRHRISITTDLGSLNMYVLFVVAKVGMVYLVFGLMDLSTWLGPDKYWRPILILLPTVIFVHQWTTINRVFRLAGIKAMLIALVGIFVYSFVVSFIPPFDGSRINETLMRRSPSFYFDADLPMPGSEANPRDQRFAYTAITLNIGRELNSMDSGFQIFSNNAPFPEVDTAEISLLIGQEKSKYSEFDWPDLSAQISADKRTPMKLIKSLKKILASNGVYSVGYAVHNPNKKFTPDKTGAYFQRIQQYDSRSFGWRERQMNGAALVEITVRGIIFDKQPVSLAELHSKCIDYITEHGGQPLLLYAADEVELLDYLAAYNEILRAYNDLRDEAVRRKFNISYRQAINDPYSFQEELSYAREQVPMILSDITDAERSRLPE